MKPKQRKNLFMWIHTFHSTETFGKCGWERESHFFLLERKFCACWKTSSESHLSISLLLSILFSCLSSALSSSPLTRAWSTWKLFSNHKRFRFEFLPPCCIGALNLAVRHIGRDEGQALNANGPQAAPWVIFKYVQNGRTTKNIFDYPQAAPWVIFKFVQNVRTTKKIHRQHLWVIFKFIQNVWSTKEFSMTHLRDKSSGSGFLSSQLPIKQEHLVGHRTPHNPEQRETVTQQEQQSCLDFAQSVETLERFWTSRLPVWERGRWRGRGRWRRRRRTPRPSGQALCSLEICILITLHLTFCSNNITNYILF